MISEPIRAAVISDTHGLLRPEVERILQSCDVVIHAGDFDNQMVFHKLKIKQPLYAVRGNNDHDWAEQLPLIRRFKLGDYRFLLVHDQADIPEDVGDAQVIIFGHSHMYFKTQKNGRLWLNPGSCGYRRFTLPLSMAVLTLKEDECQLESLFFKEEDGQIAVDKENEAFCLKTCIENKRMEEAKRQVQAEKTKQAKCAEKTEKVEKTEKAEKTGETEEQQESPGRKKRLRERIAERSGQRDQLFVIAKIMRLMKRGEAIEWVAKNLRVEPVFVETVYRICVTHPQADAHQILDKLEVNSLTQRRPFSDLH